MDLYLLMRFDANISDLVQGLNPGVKTRHISDGFRLGIQSKDFPSFAPYVTDPGLDALLEHSPSGRLEGECSLFGSTFGSQPGSFPYWYSDWGSNPGPVTVGANSHIGIRAASCTRLVNDGSRDRAPVRGIALYKKDRGWNPEPSRKQGKCSDRDSIPGSIAYRDSAQIGAQYYAYTGTKRDKTFAHLRGLHDDWEKNVNSRVKLPPPRQPLFTCFHYIHIEKNAPPTGGHVFSLIWTIFELVRDINKTNVLTNFHDDWAKIVTSRVFTSSHVIQLTGTIFELNSNIKETNVLTKCHENWAKNVTSRVFTCFQYIHIENNAPPTGGHVFLPTWTIFEHNRDINKTNVLTTFHDCSHVIQLTGTIFELNSRIKETNVLTKFHEKWATNVTSRVFTCFHYIHIENNAPPTGGHVFSLIWTIFELVRDINKTNVLTNFHDDWAKIVTSRVFTRKTARPLAAIFELDRDIIGTNLLTKFHDDQT
ncbi:hypothetical protein DPMN_008887 [Dreissena polymorpha]|uniref:Uncharacterized protein n=1 Tax=Dreissena polymorpha TaxID=45954 RepID=A0A9D4MYM0_DREPO|nr:hypothetical protein DPMN_008887 [Dreissena polymorpha]